MYGQYDKSDNKSLSIIDYLVENCYLDSSKLISEYDNLLPFSIVKFVGIIGLTGPKRIVTIVITITMYVSVVVVAIKA
jgi:hypothetical protein